MPQASFTLRSPKSPPVIIRNVTKSTSSEEVVKPCQSESTNAKEDNQRAI